MYHKLHSKQILILKCTSINTPQGGGVTMIIGLLTQKAQILIYTTVYKKTNKYYFWGFRHLFMFGNAVQRPLNLNFEFI